MSENENLSKKIENAEPETEHVMAGENEPVLETAEAQAAKAVPERKAAPKKRRGAFLGGILCGVLLTLLCMFLIRGYVTVPLGRFGILTFKMPYYESMHPADRLDTSEINRKMNEITHLIDNTYLYEADPRTMTEGIFTGMIYGLTEDKYAEYYSTEQFEQETKRLNGSYEGIGVTVRKDEATGGILVISVNSRGPAKEAGMEVDDLIIAADGVDLRTMSLDEAISGHITGPAGTSVNLKIQRGSEEIDMVVGRALILDITVRETVIPGTETGYLSITGFNRTTESEFKDSWAKLEEENVDGVVIDLRNNGGGDMNVALRMLDFLLDDHLSVTGEGGKPADTSSKGTLLLSVEDKTGNKEVYYAGDKAAVSLPIVLLVNGNSASAAEIFTGVMMDYGYRSVGEKTYGKGIVQSLYTLSDHSAVKFTTNQYRLPGGELIHGSGIVPDVEAAFEEFDDVTGTKVNYAGGEETDLVKDTQLQEAVRVLHEKQ